MLQQQTNQKVLFGHMQNLYAVVLTEYLYVNNNMLDINLFIYSEYYLCLQLKSSNFVINKDAMTCKMAVFSY